MMVRIHRDFFLKSLHTQKEVIFDTEFVILVEIVMNILGNFIK